MSKTRPRVVLVGAGGYGRLYVEALTSQDMGAELTAICDIDPNLAERVPQIRQRQIPVYPTLDAFFAKDSADLAVLVSPVHFHTDMVLSCLEHGVNVLCEKPLCLTVKEAAAMQEASKKTGKFLCIGYQLNYRRDVQALKRDILLGRFGKAKHIAVYHGFRRGAAYYARNNWAGRITCQGREVFDSPFTNACAHHFQMLTFLLGPTMRTACDIESVQAELKANKENLERLRRESESLKLENRAIEAEKSALATRLEVASTKTRIYEENLKRAQALVDIEKTEKTKILVHADKLAAGVNELAASQKKMESSQKEITKEVKDLRPQTPSEIFSKIKPSLVSITFSHTRKGILGPSTTQTHLRSVPVKIGGKYWLAFAADSTALAPTQNQYFPPEKMSVSVSGNSYRFEPLAVYSLANDPRLLAIQVPEEFIEKEKISPLQPADGFFRFPDCVVVNSKDLYYGQVPFRADYKNPSYARLDVGLLQSVFGTFSPAAGDIVISRTGDFLGFMAESDIASLISELKLGPSLPMGDKYTPAGANIFVGQISRLLRAVPYSLK
mgnify:CR=1 FL=1